MKKIFSLTICLCIAAVVLCQFSTGDKTTPEEFEAILKSATRANRDLENLPSSFSLKKFAPSPQNQGINGTCVAWSAGYAARTISLAIQKNISTQDSINNYTFSPGYIYYKIKPVTDSTCSSGASILTAMKTMTGNGAILKKEGIIDCVKSISENFELQKATPYKIKDFLSLNESYGKFTKNDILKIKKSLTEKKPVVVSLKCFGSFTKVSSTGIWTPVEDDEELGGHAVCIIGYNDKLNKGSFEIINSWGTEWGDKGFGWLSYEQLMKYANYAVELMDFETGKTEISGHIEFIKMDESIFPVSRVRINSGNSITQNKEKADFSLFKLKDTLGSGEKFKMKFRTNAPSYIYVFAEDDHAVISPLFPPKPTISAAINSSNATYYFPSDSTHARLNPPAGKENFCVLYSKSSIDFEGLTDYIRKSKVSIYQGVKNKLGTRLLDLKRVKFRDDKIQFQSPTIDNSVLCFFIEMNHK
jgi:C1A family cysteine protease